MEPTSGDSGESLPSVLGIVVSTYVSGSHTGCSVDMVAA